MSDYSIGIDLGATFSTIAFLDSNGKPETIRSEEGELTTPSVVFFDSGSTIVGREAVKAAEFDSTRVARHVKRRLGDRLHRETICGKTLPPEFIQAFILGKLKSDAERKLGPIRDAVISVPACFNEIRRKSIQDAGALAGINVVDIINEPTAAAIAHGIHSGFLNELAESDRKELVLVYDLGGGTFDATIMEIDGFRFDSIATVGDLYLGGVDWDGKLVDHIADQFERENKVDLRKQALALERLYQQSESIKKTLSFREEASIWLGDPGCSNQCRISRDDFERMTVDLLERTRMACRRLLNDAGLNWQDLTRLIVVGGATRMPMVRKMLENESGLEVDRSLSPDESVAHGAAIYANVLRNSPAGKRSLSISNINAHDLGVLGLDKKTGIQKRQIMIPRNSRIPVTSSKRFLTAKDGQQTVAVAIVEGGTETGEFATHIGECIVTDLPGNLPKGTCVKVNFQYASNGRLSADAALPDVESIAKISINRVCGLQPGEFEFWKKHVQDFKIDHLVLPKKDQVQEHPEKSLEEEIELELDELFQEMATVEMANVEMTNVEMANVEVANVEVANLEVANLEVANVELANVEIFEQIQEKSKSDRHVESETVDENRNRGRIEEDQELQNFLKDMK